MSESELKRSLVKIILTLETQHHGCREEALNIAKETLGFEIEHNPIREMINVISEDEVDKELALLK